MFLWNASYARWEYTLYKKWSFSLRICLVYVSKSAVSCGFGHINWRNPKWKTSFFVQWYFLNVSFSASKNYLQGSIFPVIPFRFDHAEDFSTPLGQYYRFFYILSILNFLLANLFSKKLFIIWGILITSRRCSICFLQYRLLIYGNS